MITAFNQIIYHIFRKNNLEELTLEEAGNYVNKYPYSSIGRFLLDLKKTSLQENPEETNGYSLYFYNAAWYELLKTNLLQADKNIIPPTGPLVDENAANIALPEFNEGKIAETTAIETTATPAIEGAATTPEQEDAGFTNIQPTAEEINKEETVETAEAAETTENAEPAESAEFIPDTEITEQEPDNQAITVAEEEAGYPLQENDSHSAPETTEPGPAPEAEHPETGSTPETEQAKDLKISARNENTGDILFMPYHSVDFFASQGIKLSDQELNKDKFGKQLKSFTEWLKAMKKLPDTTGSTELDASSEKRLSKIAADSINEKNIYTETMAEVWLKQGNTQKAIEVYEKLSLQNPSKSHYFADKIQKIKNNGE